MKNTRGMRVFFIVFDWSDKPNSVVDDHLSGTIVAKRLERHFRALPLRQLPDTALHWGKDFAVSSLQSPEELICDLSILGAPYLSSGASLLAPLASRRTGVTRYLSAPTVVGASVRTFL
jgi:hypothetical protein